VLGAVRRWQGQKLLTPAPSRTRNHQSDCVSRFDGPLASEHESSALFLLHETATREAQQPHAARAPPFPARPAFLADDPEGLLAALIDAIEAVHVAYRALMMPRESRLSVRPRLPFREAFSSKLRAALRVLLRLLDTVCACFALDFA
jgi:hypothetical protein